MMLKKGDACIQSRNMRVGCTQFFGTPYHGEIVTHGINSFKHLISTVGLSKITFAQFAEEIKRHYDTTNNAQIAEVVRVLNEVHG